MSVAFRLAVPDDAEQLLSIYGPYCQTPIAFEEVPSVEQMRERIEGITEWFPWLICEDGGEIVGYAYASPHRERVAYRWSVDTSIYVRENGRRRGLGLALYTSLFELLPLLGYVNAYAGITLPDAASVGQHEEMGFRLVGVFKQVGFKCGSWHDVGWFQKLLQLPPARPETPRPLSDMPKSGEWLRALDAGVGILKV